MFFRGGETASSESGSRASLSLTQEEQSPPSQWRHRRRASTYNETHLERADPTSPKLLRKRSFSFHESTLLRRQRHSTWSGSSLEDAKDQMRRRVLEKDCELPLPPPCTCPYFGESSKQPPPPSSSEVVIVSSDTLKPIGKSIDIDLLGRARKTEVKNYEGSNSVVTWRGSRRGSSIGK